MTQNEKDILLKDLCGRLPHGVKCKILETNEVKILGSIQYDGENTLFDFWEDDQKIKYGYQLYLSEFKPCILPISSMTEEQESYINFNTKFRTDRFGDLGLKIDEDNNFFYINMFDYTSLIDWFNKNYFDYRGLIEKGLAIDATGLNIY